uniref:Golgi SNAP receptor complex member 2 n=1 Tax=Caenorhabditis tropicalis TaxID=1561998 RepID=A0A1I7TZT8_9PELO
MEALYRNTDHLLQKVGNDMQRLGGAQNEQDAQLVVHSVYADLNTLKENCKSLDNYVSKEHPAKRQTARLKVDQLRMDVQRLEMTVSAVHTKMTQKWRAASDREELLNTRFRPNDTAVSIGDHELLLNDRLHSSHNRLDELIGQGSAVLDSLRSQHFSLRGVSQKMHGIGKALGLSNSTLQVIDRRVREDWIIFVIGCIVCCIFMYAFYRFWRG